MRGTSRSVLSATIAQSRRTKRIFYSQTARRTDLPLPFIDNEEENELSFRNGVIQLADGTNDCRRAARRHIVGIRLFAEDRRGYDGCPSRGAVRGARYFYRQKRPLACTRYSDVAEPRHFADRRRTQRTSWWRGR